MKPIIISQKITHRECDSFNQYLKDISEIPMFTPEEEVICMGKISDGVVGATDELVTRNLRFVVSVAKQYVTPTNPLEDLVNEGNIGLIVAAKKFNPNKGVRFISYAVWWIQKIIMEHLAKNGKVVRLPANKLNNLSKLNKNIDSLEQKLGRSVDISEIKEEFGEEIGGDNFELLDVLNTLTVVSLDREVGGSDGDTTPLSELISDDSNYTPTDHLTTTTDLKSNVGRMLNLLKPRDKFIMTEIYGLDGRTPKTLNEIGKEVGLTREMVRQVRNKSLLKFKKALEKTAI